MTAFNRCSKSPRYFGAGQQCAQIQRKYSGVVKQFRDLSFCDFLGQALRPLPFSPRRDLPRTPDCFSVAGKAPGWFSPFQKRARSADRACRAVARSTRSTVNASSGSTVFFLSFLTGRIPPSSPSLKGSHRSSMRDDI